MRPDVEKMEDMVDTLWMLMAVCYAAFVAVALVFGLWLGFDWALPVAIVCLVPWVVQAVRLQIQIFRVNRKTRDIKHTLKET